MGNWLCILKKFCVLCTEFEIELLQQEEANELQLIEGRPCTKLVVLLITRLEIYPLVHVPAPEIVCAELPFKYNEPAPEALMVPVLVIFP